jgi:hypothetical protein
MRKELIVENNVVDIFKEIYDIPEELVERTEEGKNFDAYDFKAGEFTYELKNNYLSTQTGNIGVEWSSRGKQSGILVTKADYQLHIVYDDVIIAFKTSRLKDFINDNINTWKVKSVPCGDVCPYTGHKLNKCYIIPIRVLEYLIEFKINIPKRSLIKPKNE